MQLKYFISSLLILTLLTFSCNQNKQKSGVKTTKSEPVDLARQAKELSKSLIVVDGHVDLPYRLRSKWEDISGRTQGGHFDFVRAKEGGLDAPFMSIYIPAKFEMNGAMDLALELIASVEKICKDYPDKFALASSPQEIELNYNKGLISLPMGLENGAPIEGRLDNLELLFEKGIRYITLCHSKDNHICDSSYDQRYTNGGLSPFGYDVVDRMNQIGMMIDVSHVSDSAFFQTVKYSKAPVIASHSSCRIFTPGFERNVSDEMIRFLAGKGGIIMINFGSYFLTSKGNEAMQKVYAQIEAGADENDPLIIAKIDSIKSQPALMGDIALVADHIEHVIKIAGIDFVGLGSDYDGVSNLPIGLEDASKIPDLLHELLKRGYSPNDIEKICSKNIFRVWTQVMDVASRSSKDS